MPNWAIIIGIDKYWREDACLKGAVRDALRFNEWLVESEAVPPGNVFLLLGPNDERPVPAGALRATQDTIIQVINRLEQKTGFQGERLYFYYAGHGLSRDHDGRLEQAILPEDFNDVNTLRSFSVSSLRSHFATSEFREQFFFFDACRNVPWEGNFRIGELPWTRQRREGAAAKRPCGTRRPSSLSCA
jgi:hypothetical protein